MRAKPQPVGSLLAGTIVLCKNGQRAKLAQDVKDLQWVGVHPIQTNRSFVVKQVVPINVNFISAVWTPNGPLIEVIQETK